MPTYPNVPNVPGVPPLRRNPNALSATLTLLVADAVRFFVSGLAPQWGIFLDGAPVIVADSVVSFGFKQDWPISDYPIEEGSFESYDKVETPFMTRVRLACGGSTSRRQAFIDSIAAIVGDLNLYDVVTPEIVYENVNVTHWDYNRTAQNGVGLVTVDLWLLQIRVNATATFSNTKSPSAAGTQSGGAVQTVPPTPSQQSSAAEVQ